MPESQLINEYGPEPTNYYGASFLNRLSFPRDDYKFLHKAFNHPSTQFLILDNLTSTSRYSSRTASGTRWRKREETPRNTLSSFSLLRAPQSLPNSSAARMSWTNLRRLLPGTPQREHLSRCLFSLELTSLQRMKVGY